MITLTTAAQDYLQQHMKTSPEGTLGIRIGLRDYGCSGFTYTVDFAENSEHDDQVFAFDVVKIFIAGKFMSAFRGTEIDYVTQGANSLLQFNNPNVVNTCGCGESFKFKDNKEEK